VCADESFYTNFFDGSDASFEGVSFCENVENPANATAIDN